MPNIINNHTGIPFPQITIQAAVNQIKLDYETAIQNGTKASTIRTSTLIKCVHNALKTAFASNNIHPSLINPSKEYLQRVINPPARQYNRPRRLVDKELKLAGFLKTKNQDVSIITNNIQIAPQILNLNSMMNGYNDVYGDVFTGSVLSVNVRSQLSSIWKNFDTLYERTFAESLNLHLRCPNMVLGEVYLIPTKEYDDDASKLRNVAFNTIDVAKYIEAFQAINSRANQNDEKYKYERCCLLVVDFDRAVPKIYNTTNELIQDGVLPQGSTASMVGLDYTNFVTDILQIYTARFPANTFI
jgi:hypothetical protein